MRNGLWRLRATTERVKYREANSCECREGEGDRKKASGVLLRVFAIDADGDRRFGGCCCIAIRIGKRHDLLVVLPSPLSPLGSSLRHPGGPES